MTEKMIGYSLLAVGILLMIFAVIQIILVFTGRAQPVEVVMYEEPQRAQDATPIDQDMLLRQLQSGGGLTGLLDSGIASGMSGFGIDPKMINSMLNLTIYYFIMQFLLSFGYKLASLGIQMLRPLNVVVKQNKLASMVGDITSTPPHE